MFSQINFHYKPFTPLSVATPCISSSFVLVSLTLVLVDPHDDDGLSFAHSDELVDGADAPPGELGQQDHALDVVILEQADVGAHLRDLTHRHHHHVVDLGKFLRVKAA